MALTHAWSGGTLLDPALNQVRIELGSVIKSHLPQEIGDHLLSQQGKLNRAKLVLAFAGAKGCWKREALDIAIGVELLHWASLLHDDIVDCAEWRRGRPSMNQVFGTGPALLLGDWFFGEAYRYFTASGLSCLDSFNRIVAAMAESELAVLLNPPEFNLNLLKYLRHIAKKTALFFEVACKSGSEAAGLDPSVQRCAGKVGFWWGMAYQINDDLMDFMQPSTTENGSIKMLEENSLPLILLKLKRPDLSKVDGLTGAQLLSLLEEEGILNRTSGIGKRCLTKAERFLDGFQPDEFRDWLSLWLKESLNRFTTPTISIKGTSDSSGSSAFVNK